MIAVARGRKSADRSGWMRPGGALPSKVGELNAEEKRYYAWLIKAMEPLGIGGKSDLLSVVLTARLAARCDKLRNEINELPSSTVKNGNGNIVINPLYAELGRTESRLRDCLCGLYLTPRTRGSTRLPAEDQAGAIGGLDAPESLLKILG